MAALAAVLPEPSARIYLYAERPTAARSWLAVSCDGAVAAELKQGMIFAIDVSPGRHALSTEAGVPAPVDVRGARGSPYRVLTRPRSS